MFAQMRKRLNKTWRCMMAKNATKSGHSARRGNTPSCYAKKNKSPFIYSESYYKWKREHTVGGNAKKQTHLYS